MAYSKEIVEPWLDTRNYPDIKLFLNGASIEVQTLTPQKVIYVAELSILASAFSLNHKL